MTNGLFGRLEDVAGETGHVDPPPRVGFFTDTSICIGCKACEVACKQWNGVPSGERLDLLGISHDNTGGLGANSWRHVAFVEQQVDVGVRWLMASDVCEHCTHAGCLDVRPTDSIQFGELDVLRERAAARVEALHERGVAEARLYGADPEGGVGGNGAFFLLLDEPQVYGLPPDPVVPTRDLRRVSFVGAAAGAFAVAAVGAFTGGRR